MKKIFTLILLTLTVFVTEIKSQAEEESSRFDPIGLIFSNVHTSFNKNGNSGAFQLTRTYLGFNYTFTGKLSSRLVFDVGDPGTGNLEMTAFVKNAYFRYKNNSFAASFGMIGTYQYDLQEDHWGYRYIYKSFQDEYGFGPSADLGAGFEYSPSDLISLDFSVLNGEGYKSLQSDNVFKTTLGITVRPLEALTLRAYYDIMPGSDLQSSLALFAGLTVDDFRLGLEYNYQANNDMIEGHDFSGISAYASKVFSDKVSVFARYDYLESGIPEGETGSWNLGDDGQLFMAGFDYLITKGIKIAPNYKGWQPSDRSEGFTSTVALNFEIKF